MRLVRTTIAVTFDNLAKYYEQETLVAGVLCRATYEDTSSAKLVPVDFPYLARRVEKEYYVSASPLILLAEQAE